ncbi:MAG: OprO/OprP family phosphate-selective porin [Planctomycetales bacterium]|nr:OprO/OprP family phosphate-selective porin [Planctomycetales bacterium]
MEAEVAELRKAVNKTQDADAAKKAAEEEEARNGYVVGSDTNMAGKWTNDGAAMQSKHGDFKYHVRGVVQLDFIGLDNNPGGIVVPGGAGTKDSVTFRRLRIGAEGTMYDQIDWVFEGDFALALQNLDPSSPAAPLTGLRSTPGFNQAGNTAGVFQPTTIFMTFKEVPILGNIRIGNQQSWLSLEHIESARFLDFMERAPIMDAFNGPNNNGYTPGISVFNNSENMRLGWQFGMYKNNAYDSGFPYDIGDSNYSYGGRVIGTPYYDEASNGRYLIHTGFGSELRTFDKNPAATQAGDNVRVRSRGDLRNTSSVLDPNFADTGNFFANNQVLLNPEIAIVAGPWLIQAEYEASFFNSAAVAKGGTSLGQVFFQGGYAEALYFLTGENRQYNRQTGVFNRVVPFENAFWAGPAGFGRGAWQLGARYDWLNLNSGLIHGGQSQNMTLGLNWFLNPNARFQFNYVCSWVNNTPYPAGAFPNGSLQGSLFSGSGVINSAGMRMDFNF